MSAFASLASRTIKVTHNGETRRGKLMIPAQSTSADAFAMLKATVAALFEISEEGLWVKYADEEGDLCTLTEHTITDMATFSTEGVLRLTLEIRASAAADPVKMECEAGCSAPDEAAASSDDALRLAIRTVLEKIPTGFKMIAQGWLQVMDPTTLHGFVDMAMEHLAAQNSDGEQSQPGKELDAMATLLSMKPQLLSMNPEALKALLLSELQRIHNAANADGAANLGGAKPDFMQLIGAMLSGKGMGKGCPGMSGGMQNQMPWENLCQGLGGGGQAPNPMHDLLGGLFATKGAGKGNAYPAAEQVPDPMQDLLGGLFAAKGVGKGSGCPAAAQSPNPMQDMLGALFAAKGAGKGVGSCPYSMPVNPASMQFPTPCEIPQASAPPASDTDSSSRTDFEASVEDLMSMGLVADRQVARELLTKHGDISTVVSILTEPLSHEFPFYISQ